MIKVGKKSSRGRKKIEIKQLVKDANKQVTFSKRRVGLFKKASELCILCDVQAAIIVFSPADKLFCFGQPTAESVVARYLNGGDDQSEASCSKTVSYKEHNRKYEEAMKVLESEKKQLAELEALTKIWNRGEWWKEGIDGKSVEELEQFVVAAFELRRRLADRAGELMMTMMHPVTKNVTLTHIM